MRLHTAASICFVKPMSPYFFGYGSLVNRATHSYPDAHRAQLAGWRRAWVRTPARDVVFLSVMKDANRTIDGLIAAVPNADWIALDAREYGYARISSGGGVIHALPTAPDIAHYAVAQENICCEGTHVILQSYLDVVVQGFLREFGEDGVARFFSSTSGWETPILNDRAAPRYQRAQQLTKAEIAVVDHYIAALTTGVQ